MRILVILSGTTVLIIVVILVVIAFFGSVVTAYGPNPFDTKPIPTSPQSVTSTTSITPKPEQSTLSDKDLDYKLGKAGFFTVGGSAIVDTGSDKRLNCRVGIGLSTEIITKLDNSTEVTVVAGPTNHNEDEYDWWEVELTDVTQCWVAGRWLYPLIPITQEN